MALDQRLLDAIALSREEYDLILRRLGREPNEVELGMFGALWSEHCGYKHSKPLLRLLPSEAAHVLTERGAENAGAVEIGDGLCVVMKVESHNHPSAIEPYQGAATGVGGIVRDIFAMGARPIALLDSLRFGPISPATPAGDLKVASTVQRNRYLFAGVVGGIAGYGNCLGIPTVGGEVYFEDAYSPNPLVNVLCVGVAPEDGLATSRARGPGNLLMLVGAETGRDGIHGASGLASTTDPARRFDELRPAVQIGDPFLEKLLMEACLELAGDHPDWFVGIQDLGAAGLTSACVEAAARAGTGFTIDVARVPRREEGMSPYEVMLSESQERMLVIVRRGYEEEVGRLFRRWELTATVIGEVTADGLARLLDSGREVASLPVALLTDPPLYRRQGEPPPGLAQRQAFSPGALADVADPQGALVALLACPSIASKLWVYRQYDHQVLTNTVLGPGADAALLRIKGTRRAIALATDGNGRYCYLDPYVGGAIAVAEAARNVVCVGARPLAVTDCLNFGSPENPHVYWQMEEVIRGMAAACRRLGIPVISGNVSLYNETEGQPVYPTPVVGMLGLLEDVEGRCGMGFQQEGDLVFLLGAELEQDAATLGGSEYLKELHGLVAGRPAIDLEREARVQAACLRAQGEGLLASCHDCSEGGLLVALAEASCIAGGLGLRAAGLAIGGRLDAALFGEAQGRFVISCPSGEGQRLEELARAEGVPLSYLGEVGGERLLLGPSVDVAVAALAEAYQEGLPRALRG